MSTQPVPSRIHLLAAKEAPVVAVIQQKRAKLFHVLAVNTQTHAIEEGSWFRGVLRPMRCDVSFDGQYMVYLAIGQGYKCWSGLCRLPWLKTLIDVENAGVNWGGGYFPSRETLMLNGWQGGDMRSPGEHPFTLATLRLYELTSGDLGILYYRWERDGYRRLGKNWGTEQERRPGPGKYVVDCIGDDGWGHRPSPEHPELQVRYIGFMDSGYRFVFSLNDHPHAIEGANWATWDSSGNLWVARPGTVEQYTLDGLRRGAPSFSLNVDQFTPPAKPEKAA